MKNDPTIYNDFWQLTDKERNKKKIIKPEIRKDYLQDRFVIVAPKRKWKLEKKEELFKKEKTSCQFCPQNINKEHFVAKEPKKGSWKIRVVRNKFPAFSKVNKKAYGIQEIIIETPHHRQGLEDLSVEDIKKVLEVYIERTKKLSKEKRVNYIEIFKNHGKEAGASVEHEHSQIFATEIIPPRILDKLQKEKEYKGCVYCDIIKKEKTGPRLVFQDKYFAVICPYASLRSYEVLIISKRHADNISELNPAERESLAKIFKSVISGIKNLDLAYNFYFHEVVKDWKQHLYFKFKPRTNIWAGLELGAGLIINALPPEEAARHYKRFLK